MTSENAYIFYHENCMDGLFAAASAYLTYGRDALYIPVSYNEYTYNEKTCTLTVGDADYYLQDAVVYILDFSFPRPVMDSLLESVGYLVWLDHHKTAFEMWNTPVGRYVSSVPSEYTIVLDNDQSGAMLAWKYFQGGATAPRIISNIDDRDRWQWKLNWSAEIAAALQARQPMTVSEAADLIPDVAYPSLISEGKSILKSAQALQRQVIQHSMPCVINGHHGYAVNSPVYPSEIGNFLAKLSQTYTLVWYMDDTGKVKCSLRSVPDFDVSEIAKSFGGGGHKNAAGFTCTMEAILGFIG